jgi:mRNA interferase HicA
MKYSEFKRWLERQGVHISRQAKGSHMILTLNGKEATFSYHGSKEMREGTRLAILKQLGLKP